MKKTTSTTQRIALVVLAMILQILLLIFLNFLGSNSLIYKIVIDLLVFFVIIHLININDNPTFKLTWIILILIFPVLGAVIYFLTSNATLKKMLGKRLRILDNQSKRIASKDENLSINIKDKVIASSYNYLYNMGYPCYQDNELKYYPFGEEVYKDMLLELKKAQKYIFMEYFIIEEGVMWNGILDILKEKVASGVEVRLIYDDLGSIFVLKNEYFKDLEFWGIKAIPFNPLIPIVSAVMNNRDHRKMMIIDGKTAFTGGINLADEYINKKQKYGIWKDNGLLIKGSAVKSMTLLFLNMWNTSVNKTNKELTVTENFLNDCNKFLPKKALSYENEGFISPYANNPYNKELVAEKVYLNVINNSTKYLYICTPYLIINFEMQSALILAAKRGVDIRIFTPGIPDKKFIKKVTEANYLPLLNGGIKIYEYSKGFNHGKVFLTDDVLATVGSVNMDYRSLYHHFENGCLIYKSPVIKEIIDDFKELLADSKEVIKVKEKESLIKACYNAILNLIAPLL